MVLILQVIGIAIALILLLTMEDAVVGSSAKQILIPLIIDLEHKEEEEMDLEVATLEADLVQT